MIPEPPSFLATAGLVLELRFRLALRGRSRAGVLAHLSAGALGLGVAGALGAGSYWLFASAPGVSSHPVWQAFALSLGAFLIGLFWIIWPVVASHIDESSELKRFLLMPARPARLFLIHTLVALFEPATLFFYPLLGGMMLGLSRTLGTPPGQMVALAVCFSLMNVAGGRMLQNLFLNLMSSRRAAETMGGAFLVFLGLSLVLPPVDVSWLASRLGGMAESERDLALLAGTARALAHTPPGWLALALAAGAAGETAAVLQAAALMLGTGAACWLAGLALLKRYVRHASGRQRTRAGVAEPPALFPAAETGGQKAAAKPSPLGRLGWIWRKELCLLGRNPKARFVFAVPFFLLVLLKILGGVALARHFLGPAWASWLWLAVAAYALLAFSGTFLANGFGFEEEAIELTFLLPVPPWCWLLGRNLAQAVFLLIQFLGLGLIVFGCDGVGGVGVGQVPLAYCGALLACLAAGNLLSVSFPRQFHFDLSRRDRLPAESSLVMISTMFAWALAQTAALYLSASFPPGRWTAALLLLFLAAWWWSWSLRWAAGQLSRRREQIIGRLLRS
ncbi:MAG: hypothetical protein QXP44_00205 [Candidatus Bathyarchaeia archaeon]